MDGLYPVGYGTELVTFDVLMNRHSKFMHPEALRRGGNFILHQEGFFGIGGGWRPIGGQPAKPGFAPEGDSFHQQQNFPSGSYYAAWDMVVRNPGGLHRAPLWNEVPIQGSQAAKDYGWHMNVADESWHAQPIELDGHDSWVKNGRKDLLVNYPFGGIIVPPQTEGLQMSIAILELADSDAVFIGMAVHNLDLSDGLLEVTWINGLDPAAMQLLELHRQNGNTTYPRPRMNEPRSASNMYGVWICKGLVVDRLPQGDSRHVWVRNDFGMVRNV